MAQVLKINLGVSFAVLWTLILKSKIKISSEKNSNETDISKSPSKKGSDY